jgi:O-antigen ligase
MFKIRLNPDRLFFWYSLFIAFPAITIFEQNISVYYFLAILIYLWKIEYPIIGFTKGIQWFAWLFALGSILATIGSFDYGGKEYLLRSLFVLPNYIYWALLIILMVQNRDLLNFSAIFRGITIGLILSLPYYFFIQSIPFIRSLPFFRGFTRNSFAFLLICFAPIVVYYFKNKYGKYIGFVIFLILSILGITLGSRSSSILVFSGCFLAYFFSGYVNIRRTSIIIFVGLVFFMFISSNSGQRIISSLNPRTGELIYNTKHTLKADKSYLVRRAMIEKGIYLFSQKPITGIGLTNFNDAAGIFKGDFEGSELVIHKDIKQGTSSHNSYITILAEGGLLLTIPFGLLLTVIIIRFFVKIRTMPDLQRPVFIGVLMMSVHLFFITAIVNVFGWYLMALAAAMVSIGDDSGGDQVDVNLMCFKSE